MTASDDLLDDILLELGGLGFLQKTILGALCAVLFLHSATHIAYVFTAMESNHRCAIPACEDEILANSTLLKNFVPFNNLEKPMKCLMYNRTYFDGDPDKYNCSISAFNKDDVIECRNYLFYDEEYFLAREFNLLCEDKRLALSLVGTVNTLGMSIGLLMSGFISDTFGRKRLLLIGISACGYIGMIKTFSSTFEWFLVFELFEAILSAGTCGCVFIMAVELVVPKDRAFVTTVLNTAYTLGEVFVAFVAWSVKSWRCMIYLTYGPCALLVLMYWFIPESVRWKLSQGKIEKVKEELRDIAQFNDKNISEDILNKLDHTTATSPTTVNFADIFMCPRLLGRFVNCCFGWITCAFLFYGLTLNSVSLYGNKYLDFTLISLTELPAYWSCNYFAEKWGRRKSICAAYFITMISCICFIFTSESSSWIFLFIYCMGKFGATAAFQIIYIITSESFPTPLRHTVMGLCSTIGRFGSITSPQTPLLSQFWGPLPMVMFALMSGLAGLLSMLLPETKDIKLPDTIQQAKNIR